MEQVTMPLTAKAALEQWNAGKPVPAFQVEAHPERQTHVYAVAFALIEGDFNLMDDLALLRRLVPGGMNVSAREFEVAYSVAYVGMKIGWARMIAQHVHPESPAITIQKPE